MRLGSLLVRAVACLALLASHPAHSQLFRAYVASDGLDTNPCTLQLPCRLLPAAITAVATGGEIWMLDSANYNTAPVNVNKSVSIVAVPGVVGSVVATGGGAGLFISAPGAKVSLRNLVIVHYTSSTYGIHFTSGAELHVADCEIVAPAIGGILASAPNSYVTVRNTVLRGSLSGFLAENTTTASLERVHAKDNTFGIVASGGARVSVKDSVAAGNQYGVRAEADTSPARLVVERSSMTGNETGVSVFALGTALAHATVSRSDVSYSSTSGLAAAQSASGTAVIVADGNTVTHNYYGFGFGSGPPTILTRGNNVLRHNNFDTGGVGSLTPLAAQ
jgi:hypothetical protein